MLYAKFHRIWSIFVTEKGSGSFKQVSMGERMSKVTFFRNRPHQSFICSAHYDFVRARTKRNTDNFCNFNMRYYGKIIRDKTPNINNIHVSYTLKTAWNFPHNKDSQYKIKKRNVNICITMSGTEIYGRKTVNKETMKTQRMIWWSFLSHQSY